LGLTDHLAFEGVYCLIPVKESDGNTVRQLCGRPAILVTFLTSRSPRAPSLNHCTEVGKALGRLHLVGLNFEGFRANDLSVESWRPLLAGITENFGSIGFEQICNGLMAELENQLNYLRLIG